MQWWLWIIVAVAVILAVAVGFLGIQARRRRGGVISARDLPTPGDQS